MIFRVECSSLEDIPNRDTSTIDEANDTLGHTVWEAEKELGEKCLDSP